MEWISRHFGEINSSEKQGENAPAHQWLFSNSAECLCNCRFTKAAGDPTRCATSCTFQAKWLRRTLQWAYSKKNTTTLPSEWIRRRTSLIKNLNVLVPPLSIFYQKRRNSSNSNTQLWWSKPSIARKSVPPVPAVTGPGGTRWARGRQNFLLGLL